MFGSNHEDDEDVEHVGTVSGGTLGADQEVHRLADEEAGVVVYVTSNANQAAGIDTVPLEETDLDDGWGSARP